MEETKFDLQTYMSKNIESLVSSIIKNTLKNPKESIFMLKFAKASKRASKIRKKEEANNLHVPPFLIASITSQCNLHCAGCYSRSNNQTNDCAPTKLLTKEEWAKVFIEARDLGINFILLAGGEPFFRIDVIKEASKVKEIMFPIFTNGTILNDHYYDIFKKNRNLVPILSIEGNKDTTDLRRGKGIYDKLVKNMVELKNRGIIFGSSITVTKNNWKEITSNEFLDDLKIKGCKAVIFVEFTAMDKDSESLELDDNDRLYLENRINELRQTIGEMIYISFPGDEKNYGGCVAAGRGFFHINAHGGAEPCPFSPYSDINLKNNSLKDAINSKLFNIIRTEHILNENHNGGCILVKKKEKIEKLLISE